MKMDEFSILQKFPKVNAPPGFEQKVMSCLAQRREGHIRRMRFLRFSFAAAGAFFLGAVILMTSLLFQRKGANSSYEKYSRLEKATPIVEPVDYSNEIRSAAQAPQTIYILEQVSEVVQTNIKY